jgi:hypothetical protein
MEKKPEANGQSAQSRPPFEVAIEGQASRVTRGHSTLFPYYEAAPPPFDRYCPTC